VALSPERRYAVNQDAEVAILAFCRRPHLQRREATTAAFSRPRFKEKTMSSYVIADPTIGGPRRLPPGTVQVTRSGTTPGRWTMPVGHFRQPRSCAVRLLPRVQRHRDRTVRPHQRRRFRRGVGVLLASANSTVFWPIGVAAGNLSATNVFGWVQVQGICDYATASNTAWPRMRTSPWEARPARWAP
jgi:hypothetical protein